MKSVNYTTGFGKAGLNAGSHALGKVHGNLKHRRTHFFRDTHDVFYYIITLGALYVSGNGAFLAMGILIGEKCVYFAIRQRGLVNGHVGTYVLRKEVPFFCMVRILPLTEYREMILVKPFKLITVYVEELL